MFTRGPRSDPVSDCDHRAIKSTQHQFHNESRNKRPVLASSALFAQCRLKRSLNVIQTQVELDYLALDLVKAWLIFLVRF